MPQLSEIKKAKDIWGARGTSFDRHKWIWSGCETCGTERWVFLYKGKARSAKCKPCSDKIHGLRLSTMPHKSRRRIGNRIKASGGYIMVTVSVDDQYISMTDKGGYVLEHRLVMAKHLRRCLLTQEIVHHLNGVRNDNRIDNLALTNSRNHDRRTIIKALQERIIELEQLHLSLVI
jgi:hypothetical protein